MTEIHVTAGKTILQGYLKTPPAGLCELVWNAFDADAKRVSIEVERNDLGGVEQVIVTDDGDGMNRERAELCLRDRWRQLETYARDDDQRWPPRSWAVWPRAVRRVLDR